MAIFPSPSCQLAVAAIFLVTVPSAFSQSAPELSLEQLKSSYLQCEQRAEVKIASGGEAMRCSVIYEILKQEAFNGDYGRLRAWFDGQAAANPGS